MSELFVSDQPRPAVNLSSVQISIWDIPQFLVSHFGSTLKIIYLMV